MKNIISLDTYNETYLSKESKKAFKEYKKSWDTILHKPKCLVFSEIQPIRNVSMIDKTWYYNTINEINHVAQIIEDKTVETLICQKNLLIQWNDAATQIQKIWKGYYTKKYSYFRLRLARSRSILHRFLLEREIKWKKIHNKKAFMIQYWFIKIYNNIKIKHKSIIKLQRRYKLYLFIKLRRRAAKIIYVWYKNLVNQYNVKKKFNDMIINMKKMEQEKLLLQYSKDFKRLRYVDKFEKNINHLANIKPKEMIIYHLVKEYENKLLLRKTIFNCSEKSPYKMNHKDKKYKKKYTRLPPLKLNATNDKR